MNDKIYLPRTGVVITERCNLKCKLCAEYAPFYDPAPHSSFECLKKYIDIYFLAVDSVGDLSIFGGEPLLNKCVYDILRYILDNYIERINRLLLLTNGSIIPNEDQLLNIVNSVEKKDKFQISISDYGMKLSPKVTEIVSLCNKIGVKYRVINYSGDNIFCDGWVDYGDHSKKYFTIEETIEHAKKCNFRKNIYSNINFEGDTAFFSRCGRAYWRYHLGVIPKNTDDVIELPKVTSNEIINELKVKIMRMISSEYSDSCSYCNGLCEDSQRFMPAEQLTADELKKIRSSINNR